LKKRYVCRGNTKFLKYGRILNDLGYSGGDLVVIKIIRVIALLGNIVGIIGVIYVSFDSHLSGYEIQILDYVWLVTLMIFFFLNILFILGENKNAISLYLQRKRLEEEIKIQEAENKLKALKNKKGD
jgi:hypothetical protein